MYLGRADQPTPGWRCAVAILREVKGRSETLALMSSPNLTEAHTTLFEDFP